MQHRPPHVVLAAVLLTALLGCSSSAVEVSTRLTPGADLPADPTFAILLEQAPVGDPPVELRGGPLLRDRVRSAIEAELRERRYRLAPLTEADVLVRFGAGVDPGPRRVPVREAEPRSAYPTSPTPVPPHSDGQVVIEMLHPDSRAVLWRGTAAGLAPGAVNDASVRRAVRAVLAEFPPVR